MEFLPNVRSALFAALAGTAAAFSVVEAATAGRGDEHSSGNADTTSEAARRPRIRASSESYDLDGALSNGVLTLQISSKPGRLPVRGAQLEVMIDGAGGRATEKPDGTYTFRSAALAKPGAREVIVTVKDGSKSDLLIGMLKQGAVAGHAEHRHDEHGHAHAGDKARASGTKSDDHKGHAGHGEKGHGDEGAVKLTPQVMKEFGVEVEKAGPGPIAHTITRPAEVTFNMDRFAHVVPHVAGIVRSVNASQGDVVTADQVLAVLDSRELAETKSAYLSALERLELAKSEFDRAEELRTRKITSEKSYLASRSAHAEARIAMRGAKQKLNAMGVSDIVLARLAKEPDAVLNRYELRARLGGTVVRRHLVQGEYVPNDREAFTVADLSTVWINISLYSADIAKVSAGQRVHLETEAGDTASGTISFVTPDVAETTRTATARVVLAGTSRSFRPGMFIKASIETGQKDAAVRVASAAIHKHDDKDVVFAREGGTFKPRAVQIGRRNGRYVEIVAGLHAGDEIATKGSFLIKSQLSKASFGDGHNH